MPDEPTGPQADILEHLQQFGATWPGAFHGTAVKALLRKGLAVLDDQGRLRLPAKEGAAGE